MRRVGGALTLIVACLSLSGGLRGVGSFSCHSLSSIFKEQCLDKCQFIKFFFYRFCFWCQSWIFSSMFLSRSFIVLSFTFRSVGHLEFLCVV